MHDRRHHEGVHRQPSRDIDAGDDAGPPDYAPHQRRDVEVDLGQHPRRSPLIDIEIRRFCRERRGDLHTARAGSDHRDSLAAGVVAVIPGVGLRMVPSKSPMPSMSTSALALT